MTNASCQREGRLWPPDVLTSASGVGGRRLPTAAAAPDEVLLDLLERAALGLRDLPGEERDGQHTEAGVQPERARSPDVGDEVEEEVGDEEVRAPVDDRADRHGVTALPQR